MLLKNDVISGELILCHAYPDIVIGSVLSTNFYRRKNLQVFDNINVYSNKLSNIQSLLFVIGVN